MKDLPDKALDQIAAYFQALSEPTRLKILNLLREQELKALADSVHRLSKQIETLLAAGQR